VGIPAEELGKVFDRFETSAESEKTGLGLGLAIVKEIVELHRGTITVESEVGKGITIESSEHDNWNVLHVTIECS
jgi:signal transduction histidine kinase